MNKKTVIECLWEYVHFRQVMTSYPFVFYNHVFFLSSYKLNFYYLLVKNIGCFKYVLNMTTT